MKIMREWKKNVFLAGAMLLVVVLAVSCTSVFQNDGSGHDKPGEWSQKWCPLCGMDLDVYRSTCHRLHYTDGRIVGYCSIHCAAKDYRKDGEKIAKLDVADFVSKEFFPAERAHYLVGSDLPGVMTVVSKKAFSSLEEAKEFQAGHGGEILSFKETLAMVYEGMDRDNRMLMKKMSTMEVMGKKVAEKYGCFACHGIDGKGCGKATAFTSPRFAQRMSSKPVLKDAIMRKDHAKNSFEDRITPPELQALMIYVWGVRGTVDQ